MALVIQISACRQTTYKMVKHKQYPSIELTVTIPKTQTQSHPVLNIRINELTHTLLISTVCVCYNPS